MAAPDKYMTTYGQFDSNRENLTCDEMKDILNYFEVGYAYDARKHQLEVTLEEFFGIQLDKAGRFPRDYCNPGRAPKRKSQLKLVLTMHHISYPNKATVAELAALFDDNIEKIRQDRDYQTSISPEDEDNLCAAASRMNVDEDQQTKQKSIKRKNTKKDAKKSKKQDDTPSPSTSHFANSPFQHTKSKQTKAEHTKAKHEASSSFANAFNASRTGVSAKAAPKASPKPSTKATASSNQGGSASTSSKKGNKQQSSSSKGLERKFGIAFAAASQGDKREAAKLMRALAKKMDAEQDEEEAEDESSDDDSSEESEDNEGARWVTADA